MIVSKCPLRVSLVGGSTDLQSFIDKYGYGQVISFPISLYTYISLSKRYFHSRFFLSFGYIITQFSENVHCYLTYRVH